MEAKTTETMTKVCSKCGKVLPISEFHSDSRTADGLSKVCRNCKLEEKREARVLQKELQQKNPLASFKPRELIEELRRRGYTGKLHFVYNIEV